jgi:hypothetical protein
MNRKPNVAVRRDLPAWFQPPREGSGFQLSLFPDACGDILAQLHVSPDELARWHANGWIPFDIKVEEHLHPAQISHIRFVRSVVRSGLNDAFIARLMKFIPEATLVDHQRMALSFVYGWVLPTPPPDTSDIDVLTAAFEQLAEEDDWDSLQYLRDRLNELLADADESE